MKKAIIVSLILFLIFLGFYTTWRTHHSSTDFDTYYYAARDVLQSSSVYVEHKDTSPYIYPPFFACLLAPLAIFSLETTAAIWYVLNLGFFFLSLVLCSRLIFTEENISILQNRFPLTPKFCVLPLLRFFF